MFSAMWVMITICLTMKGVCGADHASGSTPSEPFDISKMIPMTPNLDGKQPTISMIDRLGSLSTSFGDEDIQSLPSTPTREDSPPTLPFAPPSRSSSSASLPIPIRPRAQRSNSDPSAMSSGCGLLPIGRRPGVLSPVAERGDRSSNPSSRGAGFCMDCSPQADRESTTSSSNTPTSPDDMVGQPVLSRFHTDPLPSAGSASSGSLGGLFLPLARPDASPLDDKPHCPTGCDDGFNYVCRFGKYFKAACWYCHGKGKTDLGQRPAERDPPRDRTIVRQRSVSFRDETSPVEGQAIPSVESPVAPASPASAPPTSPRRRKVGGDVTERHQWTLTGFGVGPSGDSGSDPDDSGSEDDAPSHSRDAGEDSDKSQD